MTTWYDNWLQKYADSGINKTRTFKDVMTESQESIWYESICMYALNNWDVLINQNIDYSNTLERIEATRRTESSNFVADKHLDITWFFAVLFGILMETCLLLMVHSSTVKLRIVCVGADHCTRLAQYFDKNEMYTKIYVVHALSHGYIDLQNDKDTILRAN
jgi:hypothetical protein